MPSRCVGMFYWSIQTTNFGSLEEAQDCKLLATIHIAKGDHGKALDNLFYANSLFVEHAKEVKTWRSCPKMVPQRSFVGHVCYFDLSFGIKCDLDS